MVHRSGNTLHEFAKLLAHRTEVALHLLHQHASTLDETEFLHIHLVHDQVLNGLYMLLLLSIDGRNHDGLQRLTHLDVHLTAQRQNHRRNLLGHLHAGFKVFVDLRIICHRELVEMDRVEFSA